jgi:hypothetical protein
MIKMDSFDRAWAIVKAPFIGDDDYIHENDPNYRVERHDWESHEGEYGPDVDRNVLNIPGMQELLQDLQKFSQHCLDSMDERLAVAEGLLALGYSKSGNLDLSHRQRRNLE